MTSIRSHGPRKQKKKTLASEQGSQSRKIIALRQQINELVGNEALAMVDATIEQVKGGQYQALKYLFEIIGLYPSTDEEGQPQDSLAKILLDRLGIADLTNPAQGTQSRTVRSQPDAVE